MKAPAIATLPTAVLLEATYLLVVALVVMGCSEDMDLLEVVMEVYLEELIRTGVVLEVIFHLAAVEVTA